MESSRNICIEDLINRVENELHKYHTESTVRHYREIWNRYLKYTSECVFNESDWMAFLNEAFGIASLSDKRTRRQSQAIVAMRVLKEYLTEGQCFPWVIPRKEPTPVPDGYCDVIMQFETDMKEKGLSEQTRSDYARNLRRFAVFLSKNGMDDIRHLKPEHISPFISSVTTYHGKSISSVLSELRQFFRFLNLQGYLKEDYSFYIPRANYLKSYEHLPQFWSEEDVEKILAAIDKGNPRY